MNFFNFYSYLDSATPWQTGFQDPASPVMEGLINLHHHIFFFLIVIVVFVFWVIFKVIFNFYSPINNILLLEKDSNSFSNSEQNTFNMLRVQVLVKLLNLGRITHNYILEIIWTIIPTIVLIFIAIPSFVLLYCMDEVVNAAITLKVIGHQWYWSYEYSDYFLNFENLENNSVIFDSYMIPEDELEVGQLRLLEVDNPVVLPKNVHVRVIVTAADVLHSWAVPSLGVKIDAVPGRLNQTSLFAKREGTFYGQCSEICGVNHGFMPIVIEVVSLNDYISWIETQIENG